MNLENLNLVELNAQEVKETDGGIIPLIIGFGALLVEVGCYAAAGDMILNFKSYCKTLDAKIKAKS